jgi:hypothetical protein
MQRHGTQARNKQAITGTMDEKAQREATNQTPVLSTNSILSNIFTGSLLVLSLLSTNGNLEIKYVFLWTES